MTKPLTLDEIDEKIRSQISTQDYSAEKMIEDVKIIPLKNHVTEEGDFCELLKLNKTGAFAEIPGFQVVQINRSKIHPQAIKAWHLHFKQDEIWYVPPTSHLIVGLWDIRKKSKTKGLAKKIVLGGSSSQLLYIPRGVAHGCTNNSGKPAELFYFVSEQFSKESPDEKRLSWEILGKAFWEPRKE